MNGNCVDYDFTKRPATPHAAPETLSTRLLLRACFTVARCSRRIKIYNRRASVDINDRVDLPRTDTRPAVFFRTDVRDKTRRKGVESH